MFTAKKFIASCLRLFAFGNAIYLLVSLASTGLIFGRAAGGLYLAMGVWAALTVLLFVYAIPVAGFLAADIDQS